jgi:hypothetical protein
MTFRDINSTRLEGLIGFGLTDDEIQRFLKTCQKQLMIAGEKVQRLPDSSDEALRLLSHLSPRANAVFGAWLSKNPGSYDPDLREQLIPRFRAMEREGVVFSEDDTRAMFRCGLDLLFSESPPSAWLQFLGTNPEDQPVPEEQRQYTSDVTVSQPPIKPYEIEEFAKWVVGASSSESISEPTLKVAAQIADAVRTGDDAILRTLPTAPTGYNELRQIISTAASNRRSRATGVHGRAPSFVPFDPDKDYIEMWVIATSFRTVTIPPYFLDVEAFLEADTPFLLDGPDLRRALPEEGRIIHFGDDHLPPVKTGHPALYKIERIKTPKPIKVRVSSADRALLSLSYIPHSSTEPDEVRDWIAAYAANRDNASAVFVTSDGVCLAPADGQIHRVAQRDFDWMLEAWPSLSGIELRSGTFVPAPLPAPATRYDCAPLSFVAKRLLRRLTERRSLKLTKQQVLELAGVFEDREIDLDESRRSRMIGRLRAVGDTDAAYEDLVTELMMSPNVQRDVEQRKQLLVDGVHATLARERQALETTRKEKVALEGKLKDLQLDLDKHAKEVRAAVRKAFDAAKAKESETLGTLALWQTLLSTNQPEKKSQSSADPPAHSTTVDVSTHLYPALAESTPHLLADVLCHSGFSDELASVYASTLTIAASHGIAITFFGPGAGTIGLQIARNLTKSGTLCLDVTVGLISPVVVRGMFDGTSAGALVLRNANLSDMSTYASALLNALADRVAGDRLEAAEPAIVLAGASGPAALPWPDEIRLLSAKVNLAIAPHLADQGLLQLVPESGSPLQRKLLRRVQNLASSGPSEMHASYALLVDLLLSGEPDE